MSDYKPFIYKLSTTNSDILDRPIDKEKDILILPIINYPLFSLGFHHYIHRTKNAMEITKTIESKKKFYYIVNPFEHSIDDYKDDLNSITKKFFNMKDNDPKILSRAFYKMWEILNYFDIATKKDLNYSAIAEGPGSFLQAVLKYREKYGFDLKKDKYYGVTIHSEDGNYIEMGKQFLGYYGKLYPDLIKIQKTYPLEESKKFKTKSNGDITDIKTISLFKKEISKSKKYSDLVTADGGFDWINENYQEQESYQLVLGEIISALRVQNKNGSFVLKLFETFTMVSLKIIFILCSFYDESYICKPLFSRVSNSEKYVICKGFKYDQVKDSKFLENKITKLETILSHINSNQYLQDIYPDMQLPEKFINEFRFINVNIANKQQIMINRIVTYIRENNYFGEKYHENKQKSIEATNWWSEKFFTPKLSKDNLKLSDDISKYNSKEKDLYLD